MLITTLKIVLLLFYISQRCIEYSFSTEYRVHSVLSIGDEYEVSLGSNCEFYLQYLYMCLPFTSMNLQSHVQL